MSEQYHNISHEYKAHSESPYSIHFAQHTLLQCLGEVSGKSVLDLGCGEGSLARKMRRAGACKVVGTDISESMIALAKEEEAGEPLGIEYLVQDVLALKKIDEFNQITASYLLCNAKTREELLAMCQAIHVNLKSGGRFVSINANHEVPREFFPKFAKYGLSRTMEGPLQEGNPVTITIVVGNRKFDIANYYFSKSTHEWAFRQAGFHSFRWVRPTVSATGMEQYGTEFWQDAVDLQTIVGIECVK